MSQRAERRVLLAGALAVAGTLARLPAGASEIVVQRPPPAAPAPSTPSAPKLPVYVEDSPAAIDLLEKARALRGQDRPSDAVALYQQVIEQYPQKLMPAGERIYSDARGRAILDVRGDARLLDAYRAAYDAPAQRALELALETPIDERLAPLGSLLARYTLTKPALDAGLQLAGLYLERGASLDAASVLERLVDHPDLGAEKSRFHLLQAAVAVFTRAPDRLLAHTRALSDMRDEAALAEIAAWTERGTFPGSASVWASQRRTPQAVLPDRLGKPLWSIDIFSQPGLDAYRQQLSKYRAQGGPDNLLRAVPTADGDRVYINSAFAVTALDRNSGRTLWVATNFETDAKPDGRPMVRIVSRIPDFRGVGFDSEVVAAVVGVAAPTMMPQANSVPTALACVRKSDGSPLWRVEPRDIDETLGTTFFHGTPIVSQGRVIALLRRNQPMSGFQDAFAVCVDAHTGKTLWRRYLSSAVPSAQRFSRVLSQMTLDGPRLYVSDNLGAVTAIDTRTGDVLWLHTLMDSRAVAVAPGNPNMIRPIAPGGVAAGRALPSNAPLPSPPVLVPAGLVVASVGDTPGAIVIDPQTGRRISEITGPEWAEADCFLAAGSHIALIGANVRLLDGATLQPRWTARPGDAEARLRGLPAITSTHIAMPIPNRIVILSLADGATVLQTQVEGTTNLLALDGQLIQADTERARAYMDFAKAYAYLRSQLRDKPGDPRPALALAQLALAGEKPDALLEAINLSLDAVAQAGASAAPTTDADRAETAAARRQVFDQLLSFAEINSLKPDTRRLIFDRLGPLVSGPNDQVAVELAMGEFLAQIGKHEEAADHFQNVLSDPNLASQLYERGGATRQAGMEARMRLLALIREQGPRPYAKYDALAAARLTELTSAAKPDPAALLELERQYPLAKAVPAALLAAANAVNSTGDTPAALAHLRQAYSLGPDNETLPRVVGRIAELYSVAGKPRVASQWLERARREHPDLLPLRDGKVISIDDWLIDLGKLPNAQAALPRIAAPLGQPWLVPGQLLNPVNQPEESWPRDRVVTIAPQEALVRLDYRTGSRLDAAWFQMLPMGPIDLISHTAEQLIVLAEQGSKLLCLDTRGGKPIWAEVNPRKILADASAELRKTQPRNAEAKKFIEQLNPGGMVIRDRRVVPAAEAAGPVDATPIVRANEAVVVLADGSGVMVAIDRRSGRPLWRRQADLDKLEFIQLDNDSLAIAGPVNSELDATNSNLQVFDPLTGQPRTPVLEDKALIAWMGLGPEGSLFYVTSQEVVARRTIDGQVLWRLALAQSNIAPGSVAHTGPDLLLVQSQGDALVAIEAMTGRVLQRSQMGMPGRAGSLRVRATDQCWHLTTPLQAAAMGPDGKVRWRDGIAGNKQILAQLVGDKAVAVVSLVAGPMGGVMPRPAPPPPKPVAVPKAADGEAAGLGALALAVRRAAADGAIPPPQPADEVSADGWKFKIYLLDRLSGVMLEERDLGPLRDPIDPTRCVLLDGRLVLATPTATIVIPTAPAVPGQ